MNTAFPFRSQLFRALLSRAGPFRAGPFRTRSFLMTCGLLSVALVAAACSGSNPISDGAPAATTESPASPLMAAREFSLGNVEYLGAGVTSLGWDVTRLDPAISAVDTSMASLDIDTLTACLQEEATPTADAVFDVYELSHRGFQEVEVEPGLWLVQFGVVDVIPDISDEFHRGATYLTADGVIGTRAGASGVSCWSDAITLTEAGRAQFDKIRAFDAALDLDTIEANDTIAFDGSALFDEEGAGSGDSRDSDDTGSDVWLRREGFPADPADPEPLRSTGSDTVDLILDSDPSAFACMSYQGQESADILDRSKSAYERVSDVHVFVARFTDGTSITIYVHPEIGDEAAATVEATRYTHPLGQLPTVLREPIGRLAVRVGDETATASFREGISMQQQNAELRASTNRLAETLFHESVHTSMDSIYGYQRSQEWMDAQAADGRWLTEYGRSNPDGEDLAESMLYAYVVSHHPGRLSSEFETTIRERIPHRIAFIETIIPSDQPIFVAADLAPTCS